MLIHIGTKRKGKECVRVIEARLLFYQGFQCLLGHLVGY